MIRRLLCWLGDLFGKDWHKWEYTYVRSHRTKGTSLYYEIIEERKNPKCKHCGKVKK